MSDRLVIDRNSEVRFATFAIAELAKNVDWIVSTDGRLHLYDDATGVWSPLDQQSVHGVIASMLDGAGVRMADGQTGEIKMSWQRVRGTYQAMLCDNAIYRPGFFSEAPPGIAFRNGFVRVTADGISLDPHSPDNRCRQALPSDYNADAESPAWLTLLNSVFEGDVDASEKKLFLQEFAGACMCGIATNYDRCAVLVGPGGGGKSTFQQALEGNIFLPGSVSHISPQRWSEPYSLSLLSGKFVNIVSELPNERLHQSDIFKSVITGDVVHARDPYKSPYEFRPKAGHLFACNDLPNSSDLSEGFWSRFVFVEFKRNFRTNPAAWESRESILARVKSEAPGVALWALHGAVRLLKHGYTIPRSSTEVREEWHEESCSVREWSSQAITKSTTKKTPASQIYQSYKQWAGDNGRQPVNSNTLGKRLKRYGFMSGRTNSGRFWQVDWTQSGDTSDGASSATSDDRPGLFG